MATPVLMNSTITRHFKEVLSSLGEKEQEVLKRRVGMGLGGVRETLQSIGNSFTPAITRERVRQIEESGVKKISRIIKTTSLAAIQSSAINFLKLHAGVISCDKLVNNIIKDLNISGEINREVIEMVIQADFDVRKSKQKLGCKIFFHLPTVSRGSIESVYREAVRVLKRKRDVMTKTALYDSIVANLPKNNNFSVTFIDSCLDLYDDIVYGEDNLIGLAKWKILNPKTLKDKTVYVLKKEKIPLHFVEITNKISELLGQVVKVNTIHNELIRNPEFVLIGRGIYALRSWGFTPGTVLDVIIGVLEKNKGPMNTEKIIEAVLKVRSVKPTTIYMNLQNKNVIERVGRNYYQLKAK